MLKADARPAAATAVAGSLPRPSWLAEPWGRNRFWTRWFGYSFREQYVNALSVYSDQEVAGLRYRHRRRLPLHQDVGGQLGRAIRRVRDPARSWRRRGQGVLHFPRGHVLHDYLEARVMPRIVGAVARGEMEHRSC